MYLDVSCLRRKSIRLTVDNDSRLTVKPRIEAPASNSTSCLDPRPVSGTRSLCGTRLLPEVLRFEINVNKLNSLKSLVYGLRHTTKTAKIKKVLFFCRHGVHVLLSNSICQNSTWLDTSDDSTRSTCRANAFWLCRANRTARLDSFDTMSSTGSTRSTRSSRLARHVEPVESCRVET